MTIITMPTTMTTLTLTLIVMTMRVVVVVVVAEHRITEALATQSSTITRGAAVWLPTLFR